MKKNLFFILLTFILLSNPLNAWILNGIRNETSSEVLFQFFQGGEQGDCIKIQPKSTFCFDSAIDFPRSDLTISHESLIKHRLHKASKRANQELVFDRFNVENYLVIEVGQNSYVCCEANIGMLATWIQLLGSQNFRPLYYSFGAMSLRDYSKASGVLVIKENGGFNVEGLDPVE